MLPTTFLKLEELDLPAWCIEFFDGLVPMTKLTRLTFFEWTHADDHCYYLTILKKRYKFLCDALQNGFFPALDILTLREPEPLAKWQQRYHKVSPQEAFVESVSGSGLREYCCSSGPSLIITESRIVSC
jgi:hypothetical protein